MPETVIAADPECFFLGAQFGGVLRGVDAVAHCAEALHDPFVVHAIGDDYRAGAGIDRLMDEQERAAGRRITCPVHVLWGAQGALPLWYDVPAVWRNWADEVTGEALACGHFLPEERPDETATALRALHLH